MQIYIPVPRCRQPNFVNCWTPSAVCCKVLYDRVKLGTVTAKIGQVRDHPFLTHSLTYIIN